MRGRSPRSFQRAARLKWCLSEKLVNGLPARQAAVYSGSGTVGSPQAINESPDWLKPFEAVQLPVMQSARHFVMGVFVAAFLILFQTGTAFASQVAVRYQESTVHGLFRLKSLNGKEIGKGDLTETVDGRRVSAKLILNFNDGSTYEETTHFSQDGVFRVLDYHLLQKGPAFKETLEMTIDAAKGLVTVRCSNGQDGDPCKDHFWTEHLPIPPDISNGIVPFLVRNILPTTEKVQISMIVATPKPRLVRVSISPTGLQTFPFDGSKLEATRYALTVDPGGILGPLVKITGREAPPSFVWVLRSKVPSFLMAQQAFIDGPICRIEFASPNSAPDENAQDSGS